MSGFGSCCMGFIPASGGGGVAPPAPGTGLVIKKGVVVLSAANVAAKYFDLPPGWPDIAPGKALEVFATLDPATQYVGTDYYAAIDDAGKLRRIAWNGKAWESNPEVKAGYKTWIIYPYEGTQGNGIVERIMSLSITGSMIANKYFDLPAGWPDITDGMGNEVYLSLETATQYVGYDYISIVDGAGKLRRISWNGKGLETNPKMAEGNRVWIFYPSGVAASSWDPANRDALSRIGINADGEMTFNNVQVRDSFQESGLNINVTPAQATQKYIELPADCDPARVIVVTWEGLETYENTHWRLEQQTWPVKDRIAWSGLAMDGPAGTRAVQTGDRIGITYYSKI